MNKDAQKREDSIAHTDHQKTECILECACDDLALEQLFKPPTQGFLGADGAFSVPLSENKSLWIFGDTFVEQPTASMRRGSAFIRNSVATVDRSSESPGKVEFFWDRSQTTPASFFPHDGIHWHWVGTGALADGMLVLFCYKVAPASNFFQFTVADTCLIRVENPLDSPEKWSYEITDLGFGSMRRAFCSAAYVEDGYVYLLGFDSILFKGRSVLARVPVERLKSSPGREAYEYWVHDGSQPRWSSTPDQLVSVLDEGVSESALQRFEDLFVYTTYTPFDPAIRLYTARQLTGPWHGPIHIYDAPEHTKGEKVFTYAAKPHPEFSSKPGEIVLTYAANCSDFETVLNDMDLYYPRFVRAQLRMQQM